MPQGKGTYGSVRGRPKAKKKSYKASCSPKMKRSRKR